MLTPQQTEAMEAAIVRCVQGLTKLGVTQTRPLSRRGIHHAAFVQLGSGHLQVGLDDAAVEALGARGLPCAKRVVSRVGLTLSPLLEGRPRPSPAQGCDPRWASGGGQRITLWFGVGAGILEVRLTLGAPASQARSLRKVLVVSGNTRTRMLLGANLRRVEGLAVVGALPPRNLGQDPALSGRRDVALVDLDTCTVEELKALKDRPIYGLGTVPRGLTLRAQLAWPEGRLDKHMDWIREAVGGMLVAKGSPRGHQRKPAARVPRRKSLAPRLIVIATSFGGPQALNTVIGSLPGDLRLPVVVVQHMGVGHTRSLAEQLDHVSVLRVGEAQGGEVLAPGAVWIAPGGKHLLVQSRPAGLTLATSLAPTEHGCRPAADVLFRSVAEALGGGVVAAVLTGMGGDGAAGAVAIANAGGKVLVQDRATAAVWGMPAGVVRAGVASEVLPLDQIGPRLSALACVG